MALIVAVGLGEGSPDAARARAELDVIGGALRRRGLRAHDEPTVSRTFEAEVPTGFLHALRRVYALNRRGEPITPVDASNERRDRSFVDDVASDLDSHLLCHSDREGYYLPIDFVDPVFDRAVAGGIIGSTQRLGLELDVLAPVLGVGNGDPLDLVLATPPSVPSWRERVAWATLKKACDLSLEQGAAIRFR